MKDYYVLTMRLPPTLDGEPLEFGATVDVMIAYLAQMLAAHFKEDREVVYDRISRWAEDAVAGLAFIPPSDGVVACIPGDPREE
jgi:hypothetical protein